MKISKTGLFFAVNIMAVAALVSTFLPKSTQQTLEMSMFMFKLSLAGAMVFLSLKDEEKD